MTPDSATPEPATSRGRSWAQHDVFEVRSDGLPEDALSDIYEAINDVLAAAQVDDWDVLSQPDDLDACVQQWLAAGSRVAYAAEQCVRDYMRQHHLNAVKVDLYGEDVWTGENNEMRIHITAIHNEDSTTEPEDVVEEADEALEHPLLHLASVNFDDYYGESEITIDTRKAGG